MKLDGFDVTHEQYPPAEWYGKNVRLEKLDIFKPVPKELRGRYDVSLPVVLACCHFVCSLSLLIDVMSYNLPLFCIFKCLLIKMTVLAFFGTLKDGTGLSEWSR